MSPATGRKPSVTNDEYAKQVAEGMIALLKAGTAPWQKPWAPGSRFWPYNALTGKDYRGGNAMWLLGKAQCEGFAGARWCTYVQAQELGAQVRRGSIGTKIQFYTLKEEKESSRRKAHDESRASDAADPGKRTVIVRYATVFHESQIDGLPPPAQRPSLPPWDRLAQVESLVAATGADVRSIDSSQAFYDLHGDFIRMPLRSQFPSGDAWGATLLHELGHWTGHGTRLDRLKPGVAFGSPEYAREELRAEIASLMLGDQLGVGHDPKRHASYVAHWIKRLEEDPREVFRASGDAQRIVAYVNDLAKELELCSPPAPAQRPALMLAEAKTWEPWHDGAITTVVFVETPADVVGHQAKHPNPGARYVLLGDAGAIPDVAALPSAERRKTPILEVVEATRAGRSRPGERALPPVTFEVAMAHTKVGHVLGKRVRDALQEVGLGGVVRMPFNIGRRWADEARTRSVSEGRGR